MKNKALAVFLIAGALLAATSLWAHHSPSAIFDMTKNFVIKGTLTKVDWTNPHIVVFLDAKQGDGPVESWKFESNPPAWFKHVGVTRADFAGAIDQAVTIEGQRALDGSRYGYMRKITFANGNALDLSDSVKEEVRP